MDTEFDPAAARLAQVMVDNEAAAAPAPATLLSKRATGGRAAMLLGVLWVAGAYATFLRYNAYPLWRFDVLVGMAILAVGPIAVGWVYGRLGRLARACLLGLFAYNVARANGAGHHWSLAGAIGAGVAGHFAETAVIRFGSVIGAVVLGWAMLGFSERLSPIRTSGNVGLAGQPANAKLRPIVHVILDAQGGKPAFDIVDLAAPGTGQSITNGFRSLGFSIWPYAHSTHYFTVSSLPEMLGLGSGSGTILYDGGRSGRSELLDRYASSGRTLHVIQSDYMDVCSENRVSSCTTYRFGSLHNVPQLAFADRVLLNLGAFASMASKSEFIWPWRGLSKSFGRAGVIQAQMLDSLVKPSPLNALETSDVLVDRLRSLQPGQVVLAHILIPHFPYGVTSSCGVKRLGQWHVRISGRPLYQRYRAYAEQARCALSMTRRIVEAAGPNAIIVVHGDHGPRIVDHQPGPLPSSGNSSQEFAMGYSTLFAVRIPGNASAIVNEQVSVSELLRGLSSTQFTGIASLGEGQRLIMLHGPDGRPTVQTQLPNWRAPTGKDSPSR